MIFRFTLLRNPLLLLLTAIGAFGIASCLSNQEPEGAPPIARYVDEIRRDVQREGKRYNPGVACYVNLTRPDNRYRFFVLYLTKGTILVQGVCLNGVTDAQGRVRYFNEVNSRCSSRGLARIGER